MPSHPRTAMRAPLRALSVALASLIIATPVHAGEGGACVPIGRWVVPGHDGPMTTHGLLETLAGRRVVMLGEHHDNAAHHRWELQTLAALYGAHPDMAIGLEMFPRRVQPALDAWVAGKLTKDEFLKQSEWEKVWSYDADQYMPIFWFARMNRIPLVAINLSRDVVNRLRDQGAAAVPAAESHGFTTPAPPSDDYLEMLDGIYHQHGMNDHTRESPRKMYENDAHFHAFVSGQLVWDRTMAQGLADIANRKGHPFVAGMMGGGHLIDHFGIPHQLEALGVRDGAVLLPWDDRYDCSMLTPRFADAVFGVEQPAEEAEADQHPLLGVFLEQGPKGPRISKVIGDSVAAATGLKEGDVFVEVAGRPVSKVDEVIARVHAMEPGTWLPLAVQRGDRRLDVVAKFPPPAAHK